MFEKHLYLIIAIFLSFNAPAQQVVIKGNAKSYAGEVIKIKCYEDQISFKEKELSRCIVDTNGNFLFKFEIKETLISFIHLNVFKGILYIEPKKEYEIVLPRKVNKLPEDELNPFFEETEFYVRILNQGENDLNRLIEKFHKQYDDYVNRYFYLFKGKLDKNIVDSITIAIDQSFTGVDNLFFNQYKEYNYFSLRQMAYERNKEKLIESAFYKKPILYQNPAYMDLFNQVFSNFLAYYSKTKQGEKIPYYLIKEKSLKLIKKALSDTAILQDDNLQDLIIAKSLFENFYKDDYPKESIVFMMDSLKIASKTKEIRIIANNIYDKITSLMVSYPAPDFELPDKNNKLQSLSGLNGKFVYLNFIDPQSYTSQQDLEVLNKMASKNYPMLEIITICVCSKVDEMQKLLKDNSFNWKFLYYSNDSDLLKKYNVCAYPTYYLINPEGKLSMSPAFPPTDSSFEARYSGILKAWKKEIELRKSKKGLQH
jgi:hypothetical protein